MNSESFLPLRDVVFLKLREAILKEELPPGTRLMEVHLASELGVSRTPVREAFQELEAEGLITLRMNRGAVVNTIDRKFIRDSFEMRRLL